ncbi:MAG: DNA polymerase I [Candidatus Tagabacteria bacterium RIFCSPLOWO2_01_FULL_39_11]|uniref:DNA polymerase I n=1 Tax=Candidatus Tagabacteria bacterium RIFCSPLOWO2_01_FULL_39_11 TaxID=1802295 RepID=A0A1G2LTP9_9BACT|nr:MAG: DNA polymerase I [Candidatus Tagabacteria bacterium RIFCSPLOWO2_01_FULL_39_11]
MKSGKKQKILVLLDSHAILHRAYHALPNFSSPLGEPTGALYGFSAVLLKILRELKPNYIAACFDLPGPTFRHAVYEKYKAKRPKMAEELISQIAKSKEVLNAFKIPVYEHPGFEADDILGTVVEKLKNKKDLKIIIASGDMDTLQLVEGNKVVVYTLRKGVKDIVLYNETDVKKRFGFEPGLLPDFKGLKGDPSDNIIGVPGIGDKTAEILVREFGTIENMYKKLKSGEALFKKTGIKEGAIEKLKKNEESALFSKALAEIRRDAPIKFSLEEAGRFNEFNKEEIRKKFNQLGFKSLISRIEEMNNPKVELAANDENQGKEIAEKFNKEMFKAAEEYFWILDEEDGGIFTAFNVSSSDKSGQAKVSKLTEKDVEKNKNFFEEIFKKKRKNYAYDAKKISHYFSRYGVTSDFDFDIMIACWILEPSVPNPSLHDIFHLMKQASDVEFVSKPEDFSSLFRLKELVLEKLGKQRLLDVFLNIEMPLIRVLFKMEKKGISADAFYLKKLSERYGAKLKELEKAIYKDAGEEFNVNSTRQLANIIFGKLKLDAKGLKKTEKGSRSTRFSELLKLKSLHPVIEKIIFQRELAKLVSTYVDALPDLIADDGRIHTNFVQTGTVTGRLSSQNPNLQNLPVKTEFGRNIRQAFKPKKGFVFLSCDYSQIELRIAAILSKDKKMLGAFKKGEDVHTATASEVFSVAPGEVTSEMRNKAKVINFGIIYGMGVNALALNLNVSRNEARIFLDSYFENFSGIKSYIEKLKENAEKNGYVETFFGRKRFLPYINSQNFVLKREAERMAINMPVQGTAADIMKLAMIEVDKLLGQVLFKDKVFMILQVHDELLFEIKKDVLDKVADKIKSIMENVYKGEVVLKADVKAGNNYNNLKIFEF